MTSAAPANRQQALAARLLSNGQYSVMLTPAASGFSRWRDLAVTRWREDPTRDCWGSHVLLRDCDNGSVWSPGTQPCAGAADVCTATLSDVRGDFVHDADGLRTTLSVAVAVDCDAELRRVTLANHGDRAREIDLTSYAELVLGPAAGDAAHPAFSKMFVQTGWIAEEGGALLATRRRRSPDEPEVWAAHFVAVSGAASTSRNPEFETDRARFLGRGRTLLHAQAMQPGAALSNSSGCVLDPVFSLRRRVRVAPGASVWVAFWTVLAASRDEVIACIAPLRAADACARTFDAAAARVATQQMRLHIDDAQAERDARLAAALLVTDPDWRAPEEILQRGRGGAPVLWAKGISGDRPIALLRIADIASIGCVDELLRAQLGWRAKRFGVDVVVLNVATADAAERLQGALEALLDAQRKRLQDDAAATRAEVFALRDDTLDDALRDGLATVARLVLDAADGALDRPPGRTRTLQTPPAAHARAPMPVVRQTVETASAPTAPLEFDNGRGGFAGAGREYAIRLDDGACTPAPWINVIANAAFGFLVSAEGGGYTWSLNSQQNPLTPWPNDPVSDAPHEVLYLRDEASGDLWSATALPIRVAGASYGTRHCKGFSRFANDAHGIELDLLQFVPAADPIKLSRLRLRNRSARPRRLSISAYVEWALGANGTLPAPFVVTVSDPSTGALFARNAWRPEFGERVAFIDLAGLQQSWTGDRGEFLGRGGAVDRPAALAGEAELSGRVGAGLDPCGALQTRIDLAPDACIEIVFMLGDAASAAEARALIAKYRAADLDAVLSEACAVWNDVLDTVQVHTPDRALDILLNDWLPYQVLGCRMWARTAYYQASGAYGFRDQLQDAMALCTSRPDLVREHLLRSAARQFVEGDVQHWWLPPSGQGIRTRMTDDRIWLTYVVADYIAVTADAGVLDEIVPFLEGAVLKEGHDEAFFQPSVSRESASLYEHCARALDASLSLGVHDLPLIGTGDWNDGMNRVGAKGRGESVWLAWFLLATIEAFAPTADARGDQARTARWRACAARVRDALEKAGWDGRWYRRGYYDDGTPLGSAESAECRIDAIAQSWSVMSGAADPVHAAQAMAAVDEHLIWRDAAIAPLFTPPFDNTPLDPGYIKGYPPGIRENGGQYTHGAIWSIFAFAGLGEGDKAGELFSILNPIRHSDTPEALTRYKAEPYVACADVYSVPPHLGRGGWTWYTGSAGWLYRAGVEAVLGLRKRGDALCLDPCIPRTWPGYRMTFRHRGGQGRTTCYEIGVENPQRVNRGVALAELDGIRLPDDGTAVIALADDGGTHRVRVVLGLR